MRWETLIALLIFAGALCGCSAPASFVVAERATFRAVAPEYLEYVDADPKLNAKQKQSRRDTVAVWDAGLRAWESDGDKDPQK